jgi:hypothetical protein
MSISPSLNNSLTSTANILGNLAVSRRWHRDRSQCQILRAQLGFNKVDSSRPLPCQGCINYHGKAYGFNRANRTRLICGFHPYGWTSEGRCPGWQEQHLTLTT